MEKTGERGQWVWPLLLLLLLPILGLAPGPHRVRQEMARARRAAEFGAPAAAARHLESAAQYMPARNDVWEQAGLYALEAGNSDLAQVYLNNIPVEQRSARAWLVLGDAYQQRGDYAGARQMWQQALEAEVTSPIDVYRRIENANMQLKDYDAAIGTLKIMAPLAPGDAQIHYRLGLLLVTRRPEEALPALARAAQLDPALAPARDVIRRSVIGARISDDPAYALLSAGRAMAALDEWQIATEAFRQAIAANPGYAEAWAYLGEALQHTPAPEVGTDSPRAAGDAPSASQATGEPDYTQLPGYAELHQAQDLNPNSLATYGFLTLFWQRQDRYDLALEAAQRAVELSPNNPMLMVDLGNIQAMEGDLFTALETYRKAVAAAPRDPAYLRYLADFSLRYEFQIRAIALPAARQAVLLNPRDPANLDMMGQTLIKLNDLLNAERFLNRALRQDPNYPAAHMHLGLLYLLQGNETAALAKFDLARALDPQDPSAGQAERLLKNYFP